MTNLVLITETALLVLAAYLCGCILGYAVRRILHAARGTRQVTASVPVAPPPEPRRPRSAAARLAASVEELPLPSRAAKPDNLKQIKGIGPKIEASLHTMGINHFGQIADWSGADVDRIDAQLAFKGRIRRERWVEQAKDLARAEA